MKKQTLPYARRDIYYMWHIIVSSEAAGGNFIIIKRTSEPLSAPGFLGGPVVLDIVSAEWLEKYTLPSREDHETVAEVFKAYSLHCGADPDAARELSRITKVTDEESHRMAQAKQANKQTAKAAAPAKKAAAAPAKAPAASAADKEAKKIANLAKLKELNAKKKAERQAEGPKERKPSAASRFQDLIMEGKKSDDEIFTIVQKEFGLDDSKRSYVAWYRNKMKKDGKNPPEAKK